MRGKKMTCKDCIHYSVCINCNGYDDFIGQPFTFDYLEEQTLESQDCEDFKAKSRIIELPYNDRTNNINFDKRNRGEK